MKKKYLFIVATWATLSLTSSFALAVESVCANPIETQLFGDVTMKFCEIPAAQGIVIGSNNGQSNERPGPERNFSKFHMGQFEVTQLQFKTVMRSEPWKNSDGSLKGYVQEGDDNPAVYVSQEDAIEFANILNALDDGATYRLPTEAEWEYAARGVENRNAIYYWGNEIVRNYAYYWDNSQGRAEYARPVTSCPQPLLNDRRPGYCANDYGLMQMLGNVWEWAADVYVSSYANAPTDGHVAVTGNGSERVLRGGSWFDNAEYVYSTYRSGSDPVGRGPNVGFRLVRIPK